MKLSRHLSMVVLIVPVLGVFLSAQDSCETPVYFDSLAEGVSEYGIHETSWDKRDLTWCLLDSTADMNTSDVLNAIESAATQWEVNSGLSLQRIPDCQSADIVMLFAVGEHGDAYPFDDDGDSSGNFLAHAYFPGFGGDVHYDDYELWSNEVWDGAGQPIDLTTVALHELGHALGLLHSSNQQAVMYARYEGSRRTLSADDIEGIQAIYGSPPEDTPTPIISPEPSQSLPPYLIPILDYIVQ